jgi:hypothetical protein
MVESKKRLQTPTNKVPFSHLIVNATTLTATISYNGVRAEGIWME